MDLFAFDDEYVRRLRLRDRDTVAHFERYTYELITIKYRKKLRSVEDLKDVHQETLKRVFEKLDAVKDAHKLGAFVNSISTYVYNENVRGDLRFKRPDAVFPREPPRSLLDELIDEETRQLVRDTVNAMEPPEREILYAVYLEEEDKDAICARYNVSRDYLRVLLHRALKKFRDRFL